MNLRTYPIRAMLLFLWVKNLCVVLALECRTWLLELTTADNLYEGYGQPNFRVKLTNEKPNHF